DVSRSQRADCARAADLEDAGADGGDAAVSVGTSEYGGARAGLSQVAGAADGVGNSDAVGAIERQRGIVRDGAGAQGACGSGIADLEGAGADRGGAAVGIGTGEYGGARAGLSEAARAADHVGDGDAVR